MRDVRHNSTSLLSATEHLLLLDEIRFAWTALELLKRPERPPCTAGPSPAGHLVYLHGPSGAGKSHLVRQFLRDECRRDPKLRTVIVTASQFAAELAAASQNRAIDQFQARYRDLDLFVCEDLTALENRPETQQQLVPLIDEILKSGGRVILTACKSPGELRGVQRRLVNRCHGGTCASIDAPGPASRAALLAHFAVTKQVPLPIDAIDRLAAELAVSPRELLAAITQLDAYARQAKKRIDDDLVRRYLADEIKPPSATLPAIAHAVAQHFSVSIPGLRGQRRVQGVVVPRQCAMFLARQLTTEPLQAIARYFGRRNHTTVLHACRRIKTLAVDDAALRQHLNHIRRGLGNSEVAAGA